MAADMKTADRKELERQIDKDRARLQEIDTVIASMYEDKALGKIPDHRYEMMTEKYNREAESLQDEIREIESRFKAFTEQEVNAKMFVDIIRKYSDIRKLTPQILSDTIEKIVVGERHMENGKWEQQFDIYYRFVGLI